MTDHAGRNESDVRKRASCAVERKRPSSLHHRMLFHVEQVVDREALCKTFDHMELVCVERRKYQRAALRLHLQGKEYIPFSLYGLLEVTPCRDRGAKDPLTFAH